VLFDVQVIVSSVVHGSQYMFLGLFAMFPVLLLILLNLPGVSESMRDR